MKGDSSKEEILDTKIVGEASYCDCDIYNNSSCGSCSKRDSLIKYMSTLPLDTKAVTKDTSSSTPTSTKTKSKSDKKKSGSSVQIKSLKTTSYMGSCKSLLKNYLFIALLALFSFVYLLEGVTDYYSFHHHSNINTNIKINTMADTNANSVYDFTVKDIKDNDVNLADFKGKVMLFVNTARK